MPGNLPEDGSFGSRLKELERRIRSLETTNPLEHASIGEGGMTVKGGGTIRLVDDNGDTLATLSKGGVAVGDAPVVLDADGLDIGGGLVVVDGLGLAVGTDVEIDSDGLKIDGVLQEPGVHMDADKDATSTTLGSSYAVEASVTLSIPDWVNTLVVSAFYMISATETGGSNSGLVSCRGRLNGSLLGFETGSSSLGPSESHAAVGGGVRSITPGSSITLELEGQISSVLTGSHSAFPYLAVSVIGQR